jgi:hypothetical protein
LRGKELHCWVLKISICFYAAEVAYEMALSERKVILMHVTMKQVFKQAPLLIGVAIVVGTLVFFNMNKALVYNELMALDLIPKPEKLTELYFTNGANLPTSPTNNQVISFTFVIHNLETTDYQYDYDVIVEANGKKSTIDRGQLFIKNNQYYARSEKFKFKKINGSQEVIVELTNKRQSVDFWLGK